MKNVLLIIIGLAIFFLSQQALWAYSTDDCIQCHDVGNEEGRLIVSVKAFKNSVHGNEVSCQECHTDIVDETHITDEKSMGVDCTQCHDQENHHGLNGGNLTASKCHECHTRHRILEKNDTASSVHTKNLKKTCAQCHPVACGQLNAFSWLPSIRVAGHGKQDFSHSYDPMNCLGCHQGQAAHGEKEPINEQKCFLCHNSFQRTAAWSGYSHVNADMKEQPVSFAAGISYMIVLPFLMLMGIWTCWRQGVAKKQKKGHF